MPHSLLQSGISGTAPHPEPWRAMTPARWQQIQELLDAALAMPVAERARFVGVACGTDLELQREMDSLLLQASVADFLSATATQASGTVVRSERSLIGKQLGPYSIKSQLGCGGMGDVFLAEDTRLHR